MKIAIVTGASSGMGREFVLQLDQYVKVDEIWVIARRAAALEKLRTEMDTPIRPVCLDLCDSASFEGCKAAGQCCRLWQIRCIPKCAAGR